MAGYYGYRRGRYYRRGYRRGYRRYGGTSLRRYRTVQMNDNETKVMTFSSVYDAQVTLSEGAGTLNISALQLLAGLQNVTASDGRPYYAGMMFDRLRFRSFSCVLRPRVMPSSTATNYIVYAAWDRYATTQDTALRNSYTVRTDPSVKQVVWTPGGSGTPLRTWIYSTSRDRYQYIPIQHDVPSGSWTLPVNSSDAFFSPLLLISVEALTSASTVVQFTIQSRVTVEFQGGYSGVSTLSTSAFSSSAPALSPHPPEDIPNSQPEDGSAHLAQQFHRMQTPAERRVRSTLRQIVEPLIRTVAYGLARIRRPEQP
uniref:Uncharacterized protein n=1 Tax=unidentified TaxID=32644 RepID=A0A6G9W4E7_9ZZZZ|nr:hypothetical protein [unidentified]